MLLPLANALVVLAVIVPPVSPSVNDIPLTSIVLLDKALFGIAVKPVPILPLVSVPTVVMSLEPALGAAPTEL